MACRLQIARGRVKAMSRQRSRVSRKKPALTRGLFTWSGQRELNPRLAHPKGVYYHYTMTRCSYGRRARFVRRRVLSRFPPRQCSPFGLRASESTETRRPPLLKKAHASSDSLNNDLLFRLDDAGFDTIRQRPDKRKTLRGRSSFGSFQSDLAPQCGSAARTAFISEFPLPTGRENPGTKRRERRWVAGIGWLPPRRSASLNS